MSGAICHHDGTMVFYNSSHYPVPMSILYPWVSCTHEYPGHMSVSLKSQILSLIRISHRMVSTENVCLQLPNLLSSFISNTLQSTKLQLSLISAGTEIRTGIISWQICQNLHVVRFSWPDLVIKGYSVKIWWSFSDGTPRGPEWERGGKAVFLTSFFRTQWITWNGIQDYKGTGVVVPNNDVEDISKLPALVVLTSVNDSTAANHDGNKKPITTVFK